MTKPQAAALFTAEITRIKGSIDELRALANDPSARPYQCDLHELRVAAAELPLLVAKLDGHDPLAVLVRTFEAEAAKRGKHTKTCPCDGKPNMYPRCARQGMCIVEDGDGD